MFCRRQVTSIGRLFSLGIFAFLILATASSVCSKNFRILLVRDGSVDAVSKLPTGQVFIKAGYIDGVEEGMTGIIWRKNKYKGQIDIAEIEVVEVAAYEATCQYTMRHPDFFVLKKDRAALEPVEHTDADILAQAVEALDDNRCFEALLYFEYIFCATIDNSFVQQRIAECYKRVKQQLATLATALPARKARLMISDYLELAKRHHKYKNDLAADLYLRRIIAIDSANADAAALRDSVPTQDYSTLLSPARCE